MFHLRSFGVCVRATFWHITFTHSRLAWQNSIRTRRWTRGCTTKQFTIVLIKNVDILVRCTHTTIGVLHTMAINHKLIKHFFPFYFLFRLLPIILQCRNKSKLFGVCVNFNKFFLKVSVHLFEKIKK